MTEVTLEFIAKRLERIQTDLTELRAEVADLRAGQTVLTEMVFRVQRDMVQVKELLGRMDSRISRLEKDPTLNR